MRNVFSVFLLGLVLLGFLASCQTTVKDKSSLAPQTAAKAKAAKAATSARFAEVVEKARAAARQKERNRYENLSEIVWKPSRKPDRIKTLQNNWLRTFAHNKQISKVVFSPDGR